jgi:predicted phage terminase large subunit-like protein
MISKELTAEKKILETSLKYHIKHFFRKQKGYPFTYSHFHDKVVKAFESVLNGETKNLLVLMPPRHSKTEIAKFFCTMGFARNPASEFIYACSDLGLSLACSSEIRNSIAAPDFKKYWDISIRDDTSAKGLWKTDQGGSFWAGGFGSPIVGYGAGKMPAAMKGSQYKFAGAIIVDDPLKEQERHRSLARQDMLSFFKEILPTRKNSPETPTVMIMQPLHPEDLGQWIKKNRPDFKVIELPILEGNQPLFPEVYSYDDLMTLKEELGNEMWQAKCLLNPIKLGGNLLKTNLLKHYNILPFLKSRWIEADTAQKTEERHDYTVFQCWGKGYEGGIYLIDQFRGKVEYSDLKQRFKDFWNKHNSLDTYDPRKYGHLTCAYVEDKSSGTQIIQEAQREGNIPVVAVPRSKSKYERAVTVALPKLEAGFINIPAESSFTSDLKAEMESFTGQEDSKQAILKMDKKKTFDDQVDCIISACEHGFTEFLHSSETVRKFMDKKLKRNNNGRDRS